MKNNSLRSQEKKNQLNGYKSLLNFNHTIVSNCTHVFVEVFKKLVFLNNSLPAQLSFLSNNMLKCYMMFPVLSETMS